MRISVWMLVLAAVAVVGLAPFASGAFAQEDGRVRVVHASPDAPAVDVLVDGSAAFEGVAFGEITDYAALAAGTYGVQVVPAGETEPVVIDADLPVAGGADTTVVAVGTLDEIEPLVLEDDNSAPAAGMAHVRFVHASPDAPAVDIAVAGGPVLFEDVAFKGVGDYLPVEAGTYDLEVRVAGTETVALTVDGVALEAGTVYSLFAVGLADGSPALQAKLSVDAAHDVAEAAAMTETSQAPEQLPKTGAADPLVPTLLAAAAVLLGAGLFARRRAVPVESR